jgi:hypothetical protein
MARAPLFIVGSPRSGTSILARAAFAAGYSGFHEGNFLSLLRVLERDVDRHFATFGTKDPRVLMSRIDPGPLKLALFTTLRTVVDAQQSSALWFDKSGNPEMIEAIPTIRELWPRAVFICAKRRGIENVRSRLGKFPNHAFDYHCADWARNLAAWRAVRERAPDLPGLEIDQRDIVERPEQVSRAIAEHLELDASAADAIAHAFLHERPQETRTGSAEEVVSLARTGWSDMQIERFITLCGTEMDAYGYTTDEQYRRGRLAA